jgi:histidinol dehydrogenase
MRPPFARQAALQRAKDADAKSAAYHAVTAICEAVQARITAHGADGLADYCAQFAGTSNTAKTAILGLVLRQLGRDVRDEVREVLPLC